MKTFLIDGNAESYEGVTIEWIRGRDPIMTIYDDGIETDTVDLTKLESVSSMHAMMLEKGFTKKNGALLKTKVVGNKDPEASPKDTTEGDVGSVRGGPPKELKEQGEKPLVKERVPKKERSKHVEGNMKGTHKSSEKERSKHVEENMQRKHDLSHKLKQVHLNKENGSSIKSLTSNMYILCAGGVLGVVLLLRLRRRRRLHRYTV